MSSTRCMHFNPWVSRLVYYITFIQTSVTVQTKRRSIPIICIRLNRPFSLSIWSPSTSIREALARSFLTTIGDIPFVIRRSISTCPINARSSPMSIWFVRHCKWLRKRWICIIWAFAVPPMNFVLMISYSEERIIFNRWYSMWESPSHSTQDWRNTLHWTSSSISADSCCWPTMIFSSLNCYWISVVRWRLLKSSLAWLISNDRQSSISNAFSHREIIPISNNFVTGSAVLMLNIYWNTYTKFFTPISNASVQDFCTIFHSFSHRPDVCFMITRMNCIALSIVSLQRIVNSSRSSIRITWITNPCTVNCNSVLFRDRESARVGDGIQRFISFTFLMPQLARILCIFVPEKYKSYPLPLFSSIIFSRTMRSMEKIKSMPFHHLLNCVSDTWYK